MGKTTDHNSAESFDEHVRATSEHVSTSRSSEEVGDNTPTEEADGTPIENPSGG